MADLTTIAVALSSIKTAIDIAKFLRESDSSLARAELNLKLADLMNALADTKIQLIEVQDILIQKDRQLKEIEESFQSKSTLVRHDDAYYEIDEAGNPFGTPFCIHCWDVKHKKRQLITDPENHRKRKCTDCGQRYDGM